MANNVSFIITLIDKFSGQATKINKQLDNMRKRADSVGRGFKDVGRTMTTRLTLPIAAFGAVGTATTFQFQKQMNGVAAVTQATGAEFEALQAQAQMLGRTTQFTARDAAAGMAFLGQTGFSANEIMKVIPDTLNLAAAGNMDLASASDIASNIMKGFNADIEDAGRFVDVLALTAAKSNTNIFQLGEAMKFVAPVAESAGVSVEQTAAAMGILGDAGIQGSLAGTGMKTVIKKLITETDKLKPALGDVTLETHGFTAVIDKLAEAGLTTAGAFEIFEARGAPAILALVKQRQKLKELNGELGNAAGAAKRMADTRMRGLVGSVLRLKSAIEGMFLAFFNAPEVSEFIGKMADGFTKMANAVSNLSPRTRKLILILLALVAVIGPLLIMVGFAMTAFTGLAGVMAGIGGVSLAVIAPIGAIIAIVVLLAVRFKEVRQAIGLAVEGILATVEIGFGLVGDTLEFLMGIIGIMIALITGDFAGAWTMVKQLVVESVDGMIDKVMKLWGTMKDFFAFLKTGGKIETKTTVNQNAVQAVAKIKEAGRLEDFQAFARANPSLAPAAAANQFLNTPVDFSAPNQKAETTANVNVEVVAKDGLQANAVASTDANQGAVNVGVSNQ